MEVIRGVRLIPFDLQFFAEEKTEDATPHKRQKTRGEGQVAKSQDLSAAAVLLTGLYAMYYLSGLFSRTLITLFQECLRYLGSDAMRGSAWYLQPTSEALKDFFICGLPIGVFCAIVGTIVMVRQVGFTIVTKPFIPDFSRFNPISGLKKIASPRTLVELLKGLLKASLLLFVLYMAVKKESDFLISLMHFPLESGMSAVMIKIWELGRRMALVLLIIGVADYKYQKWEFDKSIKMSKQEIKEEHKMMEGDPLIKRRIKQKQMELARKRMMSSVPKSDVVVTNPTHIAVALMYDQHQMDAPVVVAKGVDLLAKRIRDLATDNQVPIVENKQLARSLYENVEVGESVPADLYRAVAEVLAFVYRLKGKKS